MAAFADFGASADPEHVVGRASHRRDLGDIVSVGDRALRPVDCEHLAPLLRELTPQRDERRGASPLHFNRAQADVCGRTLDELDRQPVRLFVGGAPGDEPVVGEHDRPRVRVLGNALRELEARSQVGHDRDIRPQRVAHRRRRVRRVRERADRVRVDVIDVRCRQKRVQERLDRRSRRFGIDHAAGEIVDHLRVAHRVSLPEQEQLVEPQSGEVMRLARRKVGARAFDPQHPALPAGVVDLDEFRRGVAAAVENERRVGADPARALDEQLELGRH